MIRFPQIAPDRQDPFLLVSGNTPIAKYNRIGKTTGRQLGFLTEHTLFFILQGEKLLHFQDQTLSIDAGKLILLKRGIYTISEQIPEGGQFEALMLFIPDKFLKAFYFDHIGSAARQGLPSDDKPYTLIPADEILDSFKLQYLGYFGKSIDTLYQILELKLSEVFLLLLASSAKTGILQFIRFAVNNEPADIDFIMRRHLFQSLTIEELASLSGRSLASFKRDFQKKYDASPKQWINQQRLVHAKKLLGDANKNISEIAYECGFETVSHFIRLFKKEYGATPNALRVEIAMI
jgi:AraC-like DNA-binding protein